LLITIKNGSLFKKKKPNVDNFSNYSSTNDAYRRSDIGFKSKPKKDWVKVKKRDELKTNMKVLYNKQIRRIHKIQNGRISIAGGGSSLEMPIWQIINDGVWKEKTIHNVSDFLKKNNDNKVIKIDGKDTLFKNLTYDDLKINTRVYIPSKGGEGTIKEITNKSIKVSLDNPRKYGEITIKEITLDTIRSIKNGYILVRDNEKFSEASQSDVHNFLIATMTEEAYVSKASSLSTFFDRIDKTKLKDIVNKAFAPDTPSLNYKFEVVYDTLLRAIATYKRYKRNVGEKYINIINKILNYMQDVDPKKNKNKNKSNEKVEKGFWYKCKKDYKNSYKKGEYYEITDGLGSKIWVLFNRDSKLYKWDFDFDEFSNVFDINSKIPNPYNSKNDHRL